MLRHSATVRSAWLQERGTSEACVVLGRLQHAIARSDEELASIYADRLPNALRSRLRVLDSSSAFVSIFLKSSVRTKREDPCLAESVVGHAASSVTRLL